MAKNKPSEFTAPTMSRIMEMVNNSVFAEISNGGTPATRTASDNWQLLYKASVDRGIWKDFLKHTDKEHRNNVLMILAKHRMDEVLREMLTNAILKSKYLV